MIEIEQHRGFGVVQGLGVGLEGGKAGTVYRRKTTRTWSIRSQDAAAEGADEGTGWLIRRISPTWTMIYL